MIRQDFNQGWTYKKAGEAESIAVTLPHDAQITEKRESDGAGGGGHGYFPGGVYEYEKDFFVPEEWKDKEIAILFEGIYRNTKIYVNGTEAGSHKYGYTPFIITLNACLAYGQDNYIKVVADNSKLPNSRWYTGGGIYRPVHLLMGNRTHIPWQGVKITTLSYQTAKILVETKTAGMKNPAEENILVEIMRDGNVLVTGRGAHAEIEVPNGKLWDDETPYLYECRVTLSDEAGEQDQVTETFGIRQVEWSNKGLFINGKETLLRGGCVHHDNGILGAACYEKSEERRVRIMKEVGFNAIRSSHNPASEAMLRACDKYGMYIMDETFDMWYNRKNPYDYGGDFEEFWEEDTRAMVERDYNHPSVIMYSIGNEVAEPYEQKGIDVGRKQIDLIHSMDTSRAVTCGVNLMIIGQAAKGKGIYQDGKSSAGSGDKEEKEGSNASLAFNIMASFVGTGMNKGGNSARVDALTTPFVDSLDIAGYNYGSGRYPMEGTKHPERIIFGSETFPQDICKNWEMVKKYPYLIGDFMWTSWDYLGEAGIGAWSYSGGMPFNRPYPWLLAGAGVIDILGVPDASCRYAATVWGKIDRPVIGVKPVNHPGVRPSKSVWRGTNAMESWSWRGCKGNKAEVEVYGDAAYAELLLNGRKIGRKKLKAYKAVFKTKYAPGVLKAVLYDENGRELSRQSLVSASGTSSIAAVPEETTVMAEDIAYVNVMMTGENGIVESNDDHRLTVEVENGELLAFGSANPCTREQYHTGCFTTYYGRALAIVRAGKSGTVKIRVSGEGLEEKTAEIDIQN